VAVAAELVVIVTPLVVVVAQEEEGEARILAFIITGTLWAVETGVLMEEAALVRSITTGISIVLVEAVREIT
jgi:hypothetical protein